MPKKQLDNQQPETLQEEPLSFRSTVMAAVLLTVVIAVMVGVFAWINRARQQDVISRYTQSVEQLIQDNSGKVEKLLSEVMDTCQSRFENARSGTNNYLESIECSEAKAQLDSLNKQAIKDFSATAFLRTREGSTQLLEASGKYHGNQQQFGGYRYNNQNDMNAYLFDGKDINRWQDFLWYLPGKEVIVPIEQNGQRLGYMVLSVIEK